MNTKSLGSALLGMLGAIFTTLFGGWSSGLTTLLIFMGIDYLSGLTVAAVFKNSTKSKSGALESRAGWKGLCRKGMTLLFVLIAYRLDLLIGTNYIRDAVIISFIINEALSIAENAALMGIPLPSPIKKSLDILKQKEEMEDKDNERGDGA